MPGGQFVPRDHVTHRIVAHMAHMDAARWIGKHFKHIILGPVSRTDRLKHGVLFPGLLPMGFDFGGSITRHLGANLSGMKNAGPFQ